MFILGRPISSGTSSANVEHNAIYMDGLLSMYYGFNKIVFDYLKAYHQISPEPDMGEILMLLTPKTHFYDFPDLNVNIPDKPLTRQIVDINTSPICDELKQTLIYMLKNCDIEFYT